MTKLKKAADIIKRAEQAGCSVTVDGSWVVWSPALPFDLLMEAMDVNAQIADLVRSRTGAQHD